MQLGSYEKRQIRRNSLHFSLPPGNSARLEIVKSIRRELAKEPSAEKWGMLEKHASCSQPRGSSARTATSD
jgi:hypothetical protein